MEKYDVIVVGAGPIGSYTAYQLADKGFAVCLLEQKPRIGNDIVCTGIISKEAFKRYDLPVESIKSRIDSFTFFSPSGQRLEYNHEDVFAYVVSRELFDRGLLRLAKKCGVQIHLNERVKEVRESGGSYIVATASTKYCGKAVVLATGINYALHNSLGLTKPPGFLHGSQVEVERSTPQSRIEIHLGKGFAPGSFGWVVPSDRNCSRIGVIVEKDARSCLVAMLEQRIKFPVATIDRKNLKHKPIACGPVERSVRNRVLAIGEAAGQVKTTTGGGIFYGLLCSEIAADKLAKNLTNGSDLRDYEITWRSALISELDIGTRLRKTARGLDDATIERLFAFVKQHRFWVELLVPRINFDYHSNVVFFCLESFTSLLSKKSI